MLPPWLQLDLTLLIEDEEHFQVKIRTNPLYSDKALIHLSQGILEDLIEIPSKWQWIGPFHLIVEKWNKFKHGRSEVI